MMLALGIPLPTGEGGAKRRVRGSIMRPKSNSQEVFLQRAREMRQEDTRAEKKAWIQLKDRRTLGLKFHRQVPIDRYIVDFYCHQIRLIIEIDGGVHDRPGQVKWDAKKNDRLEELGYKVLHLTNEDILNQPDSLFETIHTLYPAPGAWGHPLPLGVGILLMSDTPSSCRRSGAGAKRLLKYFSY
jgi:very-short-patch-repair endonuclease